MSSHHFNFGSQGDHNPMMSSSRAAANPTAMSLSRPDTKPTSSTASKNVIVIKYANVTSTPPAHQQHKQYQNNQDVNHLRPAPTVLSNYELVNQPLSVDVIESKFSHSISSFDISNNQLATLPKDLLCPLSNDVKQLNISHNLLDNFDCLGLISQAGQLCLSELHTLDMSHNLIKHLPATGVATLQNLESLDLSHNQIESLDELSLSSLFKLLSLDLSHNRIQVLPVRLFHKSKTLQVLHLHHNQVSINITQQLLGQLASLEVCNLSHNNISLVESLAFYDKPNLARVDLRHNQLATLRPEALRVLLNSSTTSNGRPGGASSGRHRFQHNGQPSQLQPQVNLTPSPAPVSSGPEFWLSGNPFVCDCQLEWLRHHASGANGIAHQPDTTQTGEQPNVISSGHILGRVADLDQVRCLPATRRPHPNTPSAYSSPNNRPNLFSNVIPNTYTTSEPATVSLLAAEPSTFLCKYKSHCFALCQCCDFDACDCELICPSGCQCYYNLSWRTNIIDCSASNHTSVPDRIPMDVSSVYLDGNQIDSLKPSNLIARKLLKQLYLNSTQLQFIANKTFNGLVELQSLYLNDNQLTKLQGHEFEPLVALRHLYLQSNKLDFVHSQTFMYLRSLEVLDLSNNRLTSSPNSLELFQSLTFNNIKLRHLSMAHNWWSCNCNSIDKLRTILAQKLSASSVYIVDMSQLRCYHNATTVGPHILGATVEAPTPHTKASVQYNNHCTQQADEPGWLLLSASHNPPHIPPSSLVVESPNESRQDQPEDHIERANQDELAATTSTHHHQLYRPTFAPNQPPASLAEFGYAPSQVYGSIIHNNNNQQQHPEHRNHPTTSTDAATPTQRLSGAQINHRSTLGSAMMMLFSCCAIAVLVGLTFALVKRKLRHGINSSTHKRRSGASSAGSSGSSSSAISVSGVPKRPHKHAHHEPPMSTMLMHGQYGISVAPPAPPSSGHYDNVNSSSHSNIYAMLVSSASGDGCRPESSIIGHPMTRPSPPNPSSVQQHRGNIYSSGCPAYGQQASWSPHPQQQPQLGLYEQPSYGYDSSKTCAYTTAAFGGMKTSSVYASYAAACASAANPGYSAGTLEAGRGGIATGVRRMMAKIINKSLLSMSAGESVGRSQTLHKRAEVAGAPFEGAQPIGFMSAEQVQANESKIYDAFISYDKRDKQFVSERLCAQLEFVQPQYRLADRFRDLPQAASSAYTAEAIESVIGCSQRTIVYLSASYLSNEWCKFELEAALNETVADKTHALILVLANRKCLDQMEPQTRELLFETTSRSDSHSGQPGQLVATLAGSQLAARLAPKPRVHLLLFDGREFWAGLRQLMPPKQLPVASVNPMSTQMSA